MIRGLAVFAVASCVGYTAAAEEAAVTLAGPALGTTYRVRLARGMPGLSSGEAHREVEAVLARIDRALSTWREDSDASRFNRAPAGEWVAVSDDLVAVVEIARRVHAKSRGAFDITVAPADSGRPTGMQHLESRPEPAAIRKRLDGLRIDLGGIGPGHAVDAIGSRLAELGSDAHLVELGGEVRAWGTRSDGAAWRVVLGTTGRSVALEAGAALGTATARPDRSPVDPRTGSVVNPAAGTATVRADSCAVADAWAVAALVLGFPPEADGTIVPPR